MNQQHFNNECNFRKIIIQSGYKLQQDMKKWTKTD